MFSIQEDTTKLLVRCAFCSGMGKDPFGILSRLSTCYVCDGEKAVWIEKTGAVKDCPYCGGSGVSPVGARNSCTPCGGTGVVCIEEPSQTCLHCKGTGWEPHMALYCVVCIGKGAIPIEIMEAQTSEVSTHEGKH